jgi:PAS domain S-box-containing protein
MSNHPEQRLKGRELFAPIAGVCVFAVGMAAIAGWMFDITALKSILPGLVTMKPNTASGMLLCGSALALLSLEKIPKLVRSTTAMIAVVVIALGTLTLGEYFFGWELGIDQLLFHDAGNPTEISQPGRMSPATAFCFLLAGCSLWLASRPSTMRFRLPTLAALGLSVIVVGALSLIGYATDSLFSLRWWNYTGMAINTAVGFMLLGCGLLAFARGEGGLTWSLDKLTTGAFVIGMVSLTALGGASYHFTSQLEQSAGWVSHTQEVLKELEEVSSGVATFGSSERNYINTGNEHLLDQGQDIINSIHEHVDTIRKLTVDNPHQKPRLDQLEPLIAQRIEWGEQTVVARRQQGLSAAEQMIAAGRGIALSDNIRQVIKEMEDEEYSLLDQRQKKEQAISTTTFLLLPLGVFLSLTMLSLGLFSLNAGVGERAQAEKKSRWLASFPEFNPNPIVELDSASGVVHYANPSARRLFPKLQNEGLLHPLLAGLPEAQKTLIGRETDTVRREISAEKFFFSQTITYIPETKRLRVYSTDITERKKAEEVRARFATIVESSDDAIISKTVDGVITSWNRGAEKLFGYAAKECIGKSMLMLFPPELAGEEAEILARTSRGESVDHFETVRVAKGGRRIDVSVTLSPIRNSHGEVIGASKIARDITERKQREVALRETRERLSSTLAAGSIGTWSWDIVNDRLVADEFIAGLFSIAVDAAAKGLPADAYLQAVMKEDQPRVSEALARAIKSCGRYDIEYRVPQKSGELRWLQAKGRVDGDGAGNALNFHGAVMDITERKRTEGRIRRLVDSNAQGVMFWNSKGEITGANDAFLRVVGYTREDLEAGRVGWEMMTPPEYLHLDQHSLEELAAKGVCTPFEKEFIRKDGSRVPILLGAAVFEDSPDEGVGFVLDITERKEAEEKIHQLNNELERRVIERTSQLESANKELEAFSYSVSHDLRAPLRAVNGFAGIVLEEFGSQLPEEGKDYLKRICNGGQRMGVLIDDLLAFARLSRQRVNRQSVDTNRLALNVLEELKSQLDGRQVEMKVGKLPLCYGDPALLKQVWVNLISNAIKYTRGREPAIVEIDCAREKDENVFLVRDNGAGFDMQYANKLFGVFQRLHRNDEFEGTGVGLAIVQRIVHRHGGRIWADAAVNCGATFYFTLEEENKS